MKGSARIIGSINGNGNAKGGATAKAVALGALPAGGRAEALGLIGGNGERTQDTGLRHYLYIEPTEPQQFVWMVPVVGVDYTIETSTNLKWKII